VFSASSVSIDPVDDLGSELGRYRLLERLGGGGMGEVFLAELRGEQGFTRRLALKRVRPELSADSRFREMFASEARLAAQLHHPNIVQVFDFGRVGPELFLAMEYIPGLDLARLLDRARFLALAVPRPLALAVAAGCLRALEHAHQKEPPLVHGDVCPANILLGASGEVKVLDFGLARLARPGDAQAEVRGHPAYMPPEVAFGERAGPAADIFGAGAVLYHLLAGVGPFESAENDISPLEKARRCRIPSLRWLRPEIPEGFANVVHRALAADARERFPSAQEMEDAVLRLAAAEGAEIGPRAVAQFCQAAMAQAERAPAREVSPTLVAGPPARRLPRRRWLGWALGLGAAALLLAGVYWAWPDAPRPGAPTAEPEAAADAGAAGAPSDAPSIAAEAVTAPDADAGGDEAGRLAGAPDGGRRGPAAKRAGAAAGAAADERDAGGPQPPDELLPESVREGDGGMPDAPRRAANDVFSVRANRPVACALDGAPPAPCPLEIAGGLSGPRLLAIRDEHGFEVLVRLENENGGYSLAFQARPFAVLAVDGAPRGLTPLANLRIGRGAHRVALTGDGHRPLVLDLVLP